LKKRRQKKRVRGKKSTCAKVDRKILASSLRGGSAVAWRRQQVRSMLSIVPQPEVPRAIVAGELGTMAKAILYRDLQKPPRAIRDRLALCRTSLECDGVIGPRSSELHLHQDASLPPVVKKMLEDKMREISAQQGGIDGTIISERPAGEDQGQKDHDC
jgi:hypothetical protein